MSKKKNEIQLPDELKSAEPKEVKGLTMREIRHRRALVLLQKEFCKEKMEYEVLKLKNSSPFSKNYSGKSGTMGRMTSIAGKLLGGMNYLDYAVIGFSLFNNVRKAIKIFKKK